MSTSPEHEKVPAWDLADRLGKSLREAHMSVGEMALYLGVHRNTVSAWVNDRAPISGPAIRAWADKTGVLYEWLRDGDPPTPPRPPGSSARAADRVGRTITLATRRNLVAVEDSVSEDAAYYVQVAENDPSKTSTLRLTAECSARLSYRGMLADDSTVGADLDTYAARYVA